MMLQSVQVFSIITYCSGSKFYLIHGWAGSTQTIIQSLQAEQVICPYITTIIIVSGEGYNIGVVLAIMTMLLTCTDTAQLSRLLHF